MDQITPSKILIVSGDPLRASILQRSLERAGYSTYAAEYGKKVLSIVRAQNPDLVMMDWKLPDLSGMAVTRMLRADGFNPQLRIILMGTDMAEDDRMLGLEAGADLCLVEHLNAEVYRAWVQALLRRVSPG